MSDLRTAASTTRTLRELTLSADLAACADNESHCTAVLARAYDRYDNLNEELVTHASGRALVGNAVVWIKSRCNTGKMTGQKLLFAEDDPHIRHCTSELLREEGFDVVEVENGDAAASVLETQSFDLLLTDVRMPGSKDGFDLAIHARRDNLTFPVVLITGYADNTAARIRDLGPHVALVKKPFVLQELVAALLNVTMKPAQSHEHVHGTIYL